MTTTEGAPADVRVTRERVAAWPALRVAGLTDDVGVLSLVVAGGSPDVGVARAGQVLAALLDDVVEQPFGFVVVLRLGTLDDSRALVRRRVEREDVWWLDTARPLRALSGERASSLVGGRGDRVASAAVAVRPADLVDALVAVRGRDGVVVGVPGPLAAADALGAVISADQAGRPAGGGVFVAAARLVPRTTTIVARAFGGFDDPESGVDVVTSTAVLDRLPR